MPNEAGKPKLPTFWSGQRLLASDLQLIVDAIAARITGGPGVRVTSFGNQVTISTDPQFPVKVTRLQLQIQSVQPDYLVCRSYDAAGNVGTADIYVLKEPHMRRSTWHDQTRDGWAHDYAADGASRTLSKSGEDDITEYATPTYVAGDILLASRQDVTVEVTSGKFTDLVDTTTRSWSSS